METGNGNRGFFPGFQMKVLEATISQFEFIIRELLETADIFSKKI